MIGEGRVLYSFGAFESAMQVFISGSGVASLQMDPRSRELVTQ